jgi:hypothetical protein
MSVVHLAPDREADPVLGNRGLGADLEGRIDGERVVEVERPLGDAITHVAQRDPSPFVGGQAPRQLRPGHRPAHPQHSFPVDAPEVVAQTDLTGRAQGAVELHIAQQAGERRQIGKRRLIVAYQRLLDLEIPAVDASHQVDLAA